MAKLPLSERMGVVIFGEMIEGRAHSEVAKAAKKAGIPDECVRELKPRHAFIRGMQQLVKSGLIQADFRDKATDTEKTLRFAFVTRLPGLEYAAQCVVAFDKESETIRVEKHPKEVKPEDVRAEAEKLIGKARGEWTVSDISYLVKKFVEGTCRRVMLRNGVYYVPHTHEEVAEQVRSFYDELGFTYYVLEIGFSSVDAKNVKKAIIDDIGKEMKALHDTIEKAKKEGPLSKRLGRSRLRELKKMLAQYRDLAKSTRSQLDSLLKQAGKDADVLVQATMTEADLVSAIQQGRSFNPLAVDLIEAAEDVSPRVVSQARRLAMVVEDVKPEKDVQLSLPLGNRGTALVD